MSLTPVASKMAFMMAGAVGISACSPTPLAPNGPERLRGLDEMHLDIGHVADGRDQVVVQVLGAAGDELLHQRQAQALGDAADDLALDLGRVDGAADIVRGDDPLDLDRAELDVDGDRGQLRAEAVGGVGGALVVVERRRRRVEGGDARRAPRRRRSPRRRAGRRGR